MDRSRAARGVLAAGATLFVLGVILSSATPGPRAWGLHLPGFLPALERSSVLAILLVGAGLLVFDSVRGTKRRPEPKRAAPRSASRALPRWSGWLLLLPWTFLLWRFKARTQFLGDGTVWLRDIQIGTPSPFSEPLSAAAWGAHAHLLRSLGLPVDAATAGILPISCGIIAAALLWGIASEIASTTRSRAIALGVLLTLGLAQLYFGYIESYPPVSVAMFAYLWLGLRALRGAVHPIVPGLCLGISIAFHLSCVFLAPSYLYILLMSDRPWIARVGLAMVPVAAAAGLLVLLGYPPTQWMGAFRIAARAVKPGHGAEALAKPYGALSLDHGWDLLNAILLVLPVPLLLLGSAAVGGAPSDRGTRFLAAAALPGLLLAVALVLPVAPAQDWDLTAILLLPLAVLGVKAGLSIPGLSMGGARAAGILALGAGALLSFLLVNADEAAALKRYETLVGPGSKITAYGKAYGNELLATYDADRRDFASAVAHAQRAIDAEPTNPRYWVKKGAALYDLGRYDEAIPVLLEGIRRGPWREDGYYDLGNCLVRQQRYEEAAHYYREAIRRGKPQADYFHNLGVALYYGGKPDSARALWLDVVRRWPSYPLSRNSLRLHFNE